MLLNNCCPISANTMGSWWFCYYLVLYHRLEDKPQFKGARMSCPKGHAPILSLGFITQGAAILGLGPNTEVWINAYKLQEQHMGRTSTDWIVCNLLSLAPVPHLLLYLISLLLLIPHPKFLCISQIISKYWYWSDCSSPPCVWVVTTWPLRCCVVWLLASQQRRRLLVICKRRLTWGCFAERRCRRQPVARGVVAAVSGGR